MIEAQVIRRQFLFKLFQSFSVFLFHFSNTLHTKPSHPISGRKIYTFNFIFISFLMASVHLCFIARKLTLLCVVFFSIFLLPKLNSNRFLFVSCCYIFGLLTFCSVSGENCHDEFLFKSCFFSFFNFLRRL